MKAFAEERKQIFNRLHGFYDVRVIASSLELGIFRMLAKRAMTPAEVARDASAAERGVECLLLGLNALHLVKREDSGAYSLTPLGSELFIEDSAAYLGGLVQFTEWQADALPKLMSTLKTNKPCWVGFGHYIDRPQPTADAIEEDLFTERLVGRRPQRLSGCRDFLRTRLALLRTTGSRRGSGQSHSRQ